MSNTLRFNLKICLFNAAVQKTLVHIAENFRFQYFPGSRETFLLNIFLPAEEG